MPDVEPITVSANAAWEVRCSDAQVMYARCIGCGSQVSFGESHVSAHVIAQLGRVGTHGSTCPLQPSPVIRLEG